MKAIAALLGLALPFATAKVSYHGYKAFHIDTPKEFDEVAKTLNDLNYVNLGCQSNHKGFDVAIAPESLTAFNRLGLNAQVMHEDLGKDIEQEGRTGIYICAYYSEEKGLFCSFFFYQKNYGRLLSFVSYISTSANNGSGSLPDASYFASYHSFNDHLQFLKDLQASFTKNSAIFVAGNSVEGRPLQGIHIWGSGGAGSKPAIIWHSTVHAREWITTMVCYLTQSIIEKFLSNFHDRPSST